MKNLTLEEYEAQAKSLVHDIVASGEVVVVETGDAGKFYMVRDDKLAGLVSEILEKGRRMSSKMLGL